MGKLEDDYVIPPFSVLDTKQGYWQLRKKQWLSTGLKSELGRDAGCLPKGFDEDKYGIKQKQEVSIFDPVLTEMMYKWFNIDKGSIMDPFAGGSVRGIVACKLGYSYKGIELRKEQVEANRKQAEELLNKSNIPIWFNDDSRNMEKYFKEHKFDFIFSCPPYFDLEVYSDDKVRDLSAMDFDDFKIAYKDIILKSVKYLKDDRFACFVVTEVRGKNGEYINFVDYTKKCFLDAGMIFYNEIILVNCVGTLPIRTANMFKNRKVGRMHQNVLVFYKGDMRNIQNNFTKKIEMIDLFKKEEMVELF